MRATGRRVIRARKLLITINAMMRDRCPWHPAVVAKPSCC